MRGTDCRPTALRQRASRPQLKRDPLGGALPPHKHSYVNSFGMVIARGAERRCSGGKISSPRPTTPRPRYGHGAPRTSFRELAAHGKFSTQGQARAPSHARRDRAAVPSAPSNMSLELAAPGSQRRIPFVTN